MEHFLKGDKNNYTQTLLSLYLWKQSIIIRGHTIIVMMIIINFAFHEQLKSLITTLQHKFHQLWKWLLSWSSLSRVTEVERKGQCPYITHEWDEWSLEEPFRAKTDRTSVNYSSLSWEGQRNDC